MEFALRASRRVFGRNLLDTDGTGHRCLRRLVNPMFSPAAVESYAATLESIVSELIDQIDAPGPIDFVSELAIRVPYRAMCAFLGIPTGDAARLFEMMRPIINSLDLPPTCMEEAPGAEGARGVFLRHPGRKARESRRDHTRHLGPR